MASTSQFGSSFPSHNMNFATPSISWKPREHYFNSAYYDRHFDKFERIGIMEDEDQFTYSDNLPKDPYTKNQYGGQDDHEEYGYEASDIYEASQYGDEHVEDEGYGGEEREENRIWHAGSVRNGWCKMVADVEEEQRQLEMHEERSMQLDGGGHNGDADMAETDGMASKSEDVPVQNGALANDNRVHSSAKTADQQDNDIDIDIDIYIDIDVMTDIKHPQTGRNLDECIQLLQPLIQTLAYCAPHEYDGLEIQRMALAREINWLADEAETEEQRVLVRKHQAEAARLQAERGRARVAAENELLDFKARLLDFADITTLLISERGLRAKVWAGELDGDVAMAALNVRLEAIADYNRYARAGERGRLEAEKLEAERLIGVVVECMPGKAKYESNVKGYTVGVKAGDVPYDPPTPERIQELEDMLKPKTMRSVAREPSNRKIDDVAPAPDHSAQEPKPKKTAAATPSKRKRDGDANQERLNNIGAVDEAPSVAQPSKKKRRTAEVIALEKEQKARTKANLEAAKASKKAHHDAEIAAKKAEKEAKTAAKEAEKQKLKAEKAAEKEKNKTTAQRLRESQKLATERAKIAKAQGLATGMKSGPSAWRAKKGEPGIFGTRYQLAAAEQEQGQYDDAGDQVE